MSLVGNDSLEAFEHVLYFPGHVIRYYQCLYVLADRSAALSIDLNLCPFDVVAEPGVDFLLPVVPQGGRTDHHERPLMSVDADDGQRLDGLAHTHLISQQ